MLRSPRDYLQHILDETSYLITTGKNLARAKFITDETLKRAYVRSLEIIGEAVKQLPNSLREKYPSIEWKSMAGMRDKLISDYLGVDYEIVWDVVMNKIPILYQFQIKLQQ